MFLLNVGALLEEWTRKKSLDDLARSMSLNVDRVWVRSQGTEVLMPITKVKAGDEIIVRSGNMVPLDGTVIEGEAMVNQAALTGESMPVRKIAGATVYAGTVVEEGECVFAANAVDGARVRKAQVRHGKPRPGAGGPPGAVVSGWYGRDLCAHPQRNPRNLDSDGRFLLRT